MCHLRPMNKNEFEHFLEICVQNYADELGKSKKIQNQESRKQAQDAINQLLPDGLDTNDQYLYHIINSTDAIVGFIWYGTKKSSEGFIYDFMIYEHFRNQGFGTKALELIEIEAKKLGIKKLGLHVFGHNLNAINLYKKMGYDITSLYMAKEI